MDVERLVTLHAGPVTLEGSLGVPEGARGLVVFAHGTGSSRHSPRNQFVARVLRHSGIGTLLTDLLTREEEQREALTRHLRFDIPMLAERLVAITDHASTAPEMRALAIGYFGASTGAAAALVAGARRAEVVRAIVSRGGRPDLAGAALTRVKAPTLLIVGGQDYGVLDLNREALAQLGTETPVEKSMAIVPRATHLFEEPGALEEVARLATAWFRRFLGEGASITPQPESGRA